MPKKFLILSYSIVFLALSFNLADAASIVKTDQTEFTAAGSSFESTTATVEPGNIILETSGAQVLWTTDGISMAALTNYQENARIVPDGSGGAIITWQDDRNAASTGTDIYAQRIDPQGNKLWGNNDLVVCNYSAAQMYPQLVLDGSGGVIITWTDRRSTTDYDIYAQKIDISTGQTQWRGNGELISDQTNDQDHPQIAADGSGGAIIVWEYFAAVSNHDIYAQRILSDGTVDLSWVPNGAVICNDSQEQLDPHIISDGNHGAIIAWHDKRNTVDFDIYAQRIDGDGNIHTGWNPTNGEAICVQSDNQQFARLLSDGNNGTIITWQDNRNSVSTGTDIYVQRIDGNGDTQWLGDGEPLCTAIYDQMYPQIITDGNGGAIIAWHDNRNTVSTSTDIYAQRIGSNGGRLWSFNGEPVYQGAYQQGYPKMTSDGFGGAIIAWSDDRNGTDDIYAQRIDGNANPLWPAAGISATSAVDIQDEQELASDGAGGAIIVWNDERDSATLDTDVYAQRINDVYANSGKYTTEKIENTDSAFLGWTTLSWTGQGNITAEVKTAASSAELDTAAWTAVSNGGNIPDPPNLWLQARFYFTPGDLGTITSTLSALSINYSSDTVAPVISNVKIDGSTAVSGMQITPNPSIEATISDAGIGVDAASIKVNIDGTDYAPDSFSASLMLYRASTLSASSLHNISIRAADNEGNLSTWEATGLQVVEPITPPSSTGSYFVPNPFDPNSGTATISYNLPQDGDVTLLIFTLSAELVYKQVFIGQGAGAKTIAWDGRDSSGNILQNGVYAYKIVSGGKVIASGNIIIIK